MALDIYENMKFFRRYNDPQKIDCNDISLKLRLTNRCNQFCHYCPYRNNSESFLKWEQLKKMLDFVEMLNNDYFYIYLHGGEPTLHPDFIEFVHKLNGILARKNVDYFIYFDTNLTMSVSTLNALFRNVDAPKFKINCTYHIKQCLQFNDFLDKYLMLDRFRLQKQLNVMFQYDYYDALKDICYKLIDFNHVNIVPKPILYEGEEHQYTAKQKEFFYLNDPRRVYYFDDYDKKHIFTFNKI